MADCDFNQAALHPAYPIKCRTSTERTQAPESVDTGRASRLDPLENTIDGELYKQGYPERVLCPEYGRIGAGQDEAGRDETGAGKMKHMHTHIYPNSGHKTRSGYPCLYSSPEHNRR
jgi:hypothetical protein